MIVFFGDDLAVAERLSQIRVPVERIEVRFNPEWAHRPLAEVAYFLTDGGPAVVVIGPSTGNIDPIGVIAALDSHSPGTSVVLCHDATSDIILAAMRAGARDVITPDIPDAELYSSIGRALASSVRHRDLHQFEPPPPQPQHHLPAAVVSVISPKGGVGRTMLATSLGVGLARTNPGEVVLVDLDVQFGDISSVLGLSPTKTLADAATAARDGVDSTQLKTFLTHHPSDLYVLAGTESLMEAEGIDPSVMKEILQMLAEDFRYVVIDNSAAVTDFTLAALEASTDVLLLSSTDVPGVRGLRRVLDALDAIGMTEQKRHLVINRSTDRYGVTVEHVEEAADMPAAIRIPAAKEVAVATNQGVPVVDLQGRNPVLKAIQPLIDSLGIPEQAEQKRSVKFWKRESA